MKFRVTIKSMCRCSLLKLRLHHWFYLLLLVCLARQTWAHDLPFSYVNLHVSDDGVTGTCVLHSFDLGHELNIMPAKLLEPAVASQQLSAITGLLASRLTVQVDGQVVSPEWLGLTVLSDRQMISLQVHYTVSHRPATLAVKAVLFPYDPNHQTYLNIDERGIVTQSILTAANPSFDYFSGSAHGAFAVMRKFVPAGIHHILIGPDHLLFLIGLLLPGGRIRRLALIVSMFTLAHSITLTLAAVNILTPSALLIEPAIALSIVFVGLDNLRPGRHRDVRPWIAFAFGLLHGFGFANVLREMALPARALGWSLFSFNAGVEIGQLMVVSVVTLALVTLQRRSEVARQRVAFAGSIFVIAAGGFWFVQRVFVARL